MFSASRACCGISPQLTTQLGCTRHLSHLGDPAMLRDGLPTLIISNVISPNPLKSFNWAHGVSLGQISALRHLGSTWLSKQLMCI